MTSGRILRRPAVLEATGLSTSHVYELMRDGKFPLPIKLGARSVGWYEAEVLAWVEGRAAAGRAGPKQRAAA